MQNDTFNKQPHFWTDEHGVQYDKEHKVLVKAPKDIVKYSVIKGTKSIGKAAFSNCEQLKSVILPDSIVEIQHYAFAGCKSIFSFAIPNRVISIGNEVFLNCSELSAIRMPSGLNDYETDIFNGCVNLSKVFVPKGKKYKYDELLYGHSVLTFEYNDQDDGEVKALDNILHGITDEEGVLYDYDEQIVLSATKELESYQVKLGTIGIRDYAFRSAELTDNAKSLKRLYLPYTIEVICDATFTDLEVLERVNIPEKAIFLGSSNPFAGCPNLHNIQWDSKKTIKDNTLVYNKERTTLIACLNWHYRDGIMQCWTLRDFVHQYGPRMQVGSYIDYEGRDITKCVLTTSTGNRTSVFFEPGYEWSLKAEDIAAHKNELFVIEIGPAYFPPEGFSVTSPSGLNLEDMSVGTFLLCSEKPAIIEQEPNVRIPEGVETIFDKAFFGNKVLQEIILPTTLNKIGENAFEGCTSLRKIIIPLGTRSKYETMLESKAFLLVEKYYDTQKEMPDLEFPVGSICNGQYIEERSFWADMELNGSGEVLYPNGDKYNGAFDLGSPYGWGVVKFKNGHSYKGYFAHQPNGIGYSNEDNGMVVGNFLEGRLHGWGISYKNQIFKFGYWIKGVLMYDETYKTLWVRHNISEGRVSYRGNLIQIDEDHKFIRFGIPERNVTAGGIQLTSKWPAIGFEFFEDGTVKFGEIRDHKSGDYILCKNNGSMEYGSWKDGTKRCNRRLSDFQSETRRYEVNGLDVY